MLGTNGLNGRCHGQALPRSGHNLKMQMRHPVQNRITRVTKATTAMSLSYDGTTVNLPANGKSHFLHIDDFSKDELIAMLKTAKDVKARLKAGDQSYKPFAGKSMAMIFTKPSMRTRVSFETVRFIPSPTSHSPCHIHTQNSPPSLSILYSYIPPKINNRDSSNLEAMPST